ncbi:hypothetical protein ACJIZ3_010454 [Penstemon smallii]|uniref:DUF1664 domain-containing protein n=1 Tax=Penstemon smallii TaxID=265156 RepID=A0ABD3TGT2_9LAMI
MALPLGKLTIIVGAGLVGSVLAKEGRVPSMSDFFSGAFKMVFKQLKKDDSTTSSSKPKYDSLMQQVNTLRQELELFASNRSITIVTGDRSGSGKYGVIVVVIVVGSGYVWWKATKKHLSSRIDRVDCKIDECADNTSATREEVSEVRCDVKLIGADVQSVHHVVRSLETKISRIEGRQGAAFRPALELPQAASLPPSISLEPSSPSTSNGDHKRRASFVPSSSSQNTSVSASGLKELHEISDGVGISSLKTPDASNGIHASEETKDDNSGSGVFGRRFAGMSFLSRSRSVIPTFNEHSKISRHFFPNHDIDIFIFVKFPDPATKLFQIPAVKMEAVRSHRTSLASADDAVSTIQIYRSPLVTEVRLEDFELHAIHRIRCYASLVVSTCVCFVVQYIGFT